MIDLLQGDCRDVLKTLPADSVQCVVTSPPYYGLRDYNCSGQIGLEHSPEAYVVELVSVFREVRRVLRDDGTVWLNLGDSYATQGVHGRVWTSDPCGENRIAKARGKASGTKVPPGMKPKDLLMIPSRVALALQADGWYVRSHIIWAKPNPMPESVRDRPTSAHESVFLLTRSHRYFYDDYAVSEAGIYGGMRNLRNVWSIVGKQYKGAHFATFPPGLAEPCIKAGTSEKGHCPHCGAPWHRLTERTRRFEGNSARAGRAVDDINASGKWAGHQQGNKNLKSGPVLDVVTIGWKPSCSCPEHVPVPCTVLDPFSGAGTTALVSKNLGRNCIGIELNPEYIDLTRERLGLNKPSLFAAE